MKRWEEDGGFLSPCVEEGRSVSSFSSIPKPPSFRLWSLEFSYSQIVFLWSVLTGAGAGNSHPSSSSPQELKYDFEAGEVQVYLLPPGQTRQLVNASYPSSPSSCSLFCLLILSEMPPGGNLKPAKIIWWGSVFGRSWGKAELLWGLLWCQDSLSAHGEIW